MKKNFAVTLVLQLVLGLLFSGTVNAATLTVRIGSEKQVIDGFGASDAWRCQYVGKYWPLEKREAIADLLFSSEEDDDGNPKGIGLSIWRFYLSAGTTEQGDRSGISNEWRRGESFLDADGRYDWSKQGGQQWFLRAAKKRGVERIQAFSNATPVQFSNNGKGFADKGDIRLNVRPGKLDDFARYLVDVAEHFENEGIPIDYLSPINEPQWKWDEGNQEGTPALNEDIYVFTRYLSRMLQERKLSTQLTLGEAGHIGYLARTMGEDSRDNQIEVFFNPKSSLYIGNLPHVLPVISGHSYFTVWPVDKQVTYRRQLAEKIDALSPSIHYWQSEYCILGRNGEIGGGGRRDLGMETALYVARLIHHDLTVANATSWQWWTAVTQCDYKDGLVYLDSGIHPETGKVQLDKKALKLDGNVRDSKLLWVLGNYSRFVRPGMIRVSVEWSVPQSPVDGILASAYKSVEGSNVALVLVNLSQDGHDITLNLAKNPKLKSEKIHTFTTSKTKNLQHEVGMASKIQLEPRSVTTIRYTIGEQGL